ncbi:MAG: YkoF family thiamine/hydroxymethylpyrimidine-binding protein [Anaerolineae bacterium]|nr:Ykof family thiamine-binding protein [Thermoflexales bacterium]MDW8407559.1 YkoF family thiamine/hydroxymethylpyrimidine-binding protein [Anaerolineae bacterium]
MDEQTISAQISLYPLRPEHLDSVIQDAIALWQQRGLAVWPGIMSTVIAGKPQEIWDAARAAFDLAVARCETVMVVTLSNACPLPADDAAPQSAALPPQHTS